MGLDLGYYIVACVIVAGVEEGNGRAMGSYGTIDSDGGEDARPVACAALLSLLKLLL